MKIIEDYYNLKYIGRISHLYEHLIIFTNTQTQQDLKLKASKLRGSSLKEQAALKVSMELEKNEDILELISQGLIPSCLERLLTKYI